MKLGFVHLPKTAGTPLGEYMNKYGDDKFVNFVHTSVSKIKDRQNYFLFGFVRNPFEWYVSRYFYFIKKGVIEKGISKPNDAGLFGENFHDKFKTLKQHLEFGVKNKKGLRRFWFFEMYDYMFKINGELALDYIGKVETINKDMDYLCKKFNLEPRETFRQFCENNPGKLNKSIHKDFRSYYGKEMIELIYEKDKEIFETYNYDLFNNR